MAQYTPIATKNKRVMEVPTTADLIFNNLLPKPVHNWYCGGCKNHRFCEKCIFSTRYRGKNDNRPRPWVEEAFPLDGKGFEEVVVVRPRGRTQVNKSRKL